MFVKKGAILDGNNLLYAAYHSLFKVDEVTSGLLAYTFLSKVRFVLTKMGTLNVVPFIIWDGENSRDARQTLFPQYKGQRPRTASVIHETKQALMEELVQIAPRLSISIKGVEADDLMAILALRDRSSNWVMCTRDADLMQLISPTVEYYNVFTRKMWDEKAFDDKYGFSPEILVLYKALVGDPSDNWPGVRGVGKKTAETLLVGKTVEDAIQAITDKLNDKDFATFETGVRLCILPITDKDILDQCETCIHTILSDEVEVGSWSSLHDRFDIVKGNNAKFRVGVWPTHND